MPQTAFNPAYLADPSLYASQLGVDQQQAIANLLLQQGLSPQGGTESVGGVAIRRSPMEGIAKLAALLSGQSIQQQANQGAMGLMERQSEAMRPMFGLPSQLALALDPSAQGPAQGGPLSIPGMSPAQNMMSYSTDPAAHIKALQAAMSPTDASKQAYQGGFDPVRANQAAFEKANTDPEILALRQAGADPLTVYRAVLGKMAKNAEIDRKAGNQFSNPVTGEAGTVPKMPENANPTGAPGPTGAIPGVEPIPGAPGVVAGNTAASSAGTAMNDIVDVPQPDGTTRKMTRAQAVQMAGGPTFQVAPGTESAFRATLAKRNPEMLPAFDKEFGGKTPGFAAGQSTQSAAAAAQSGALPQKTMEDRFTTLRDANGQAETTNSYLQNIKALAEKASTGPFADRVALAQAIAAPFMTSADEKLTSKQLLDKYSNQIVARLGQGGLGTDAARSILQSAYPNSHMTKEAIADAADNLMGANGMIQAKTRLLSPVAAARDPVAYQQKEQAFDANADPRMWQYASIQDPAKRKAFLQSVLKGDPKFLEKAAKLHEMGAL